MSLKKRSDEIKLNKIEIWTSGWLRFIQPQFEIHLSKKWSTPSRVKPNSCLKPTPVFIILKALASRLWLFTIRIHCSKPSEPLLLVYFGFSNPRVLLPQKCYNCKIFCYNDEIRCYNQKNSNKFWAKKIVAKNFTIVAILVKLTFFQKSKKKFFATFFL